MVVAVCGYVFIIMLSLITTVVGALPIKPWSWIVLIFPPLSFMKAIVLVSIPPICTHGLGFVQLTRLCGMSACSLGAYLWRQHHPQ